LDLLYFSAFFSLMRIEFNVDNYILDYLNKHRVEGLS